MFIGLANNSSCICDSCPFCLMPLCILTCESFKAKETMTKHRPSLLRSVIICRTGQEAQTSPSSCSAFQSYILRSLYQLQMPRKIQAQEDKKRMLEAQQSNLYSTQWKMDLICLFPPALYSAFCCYKMREVRNYEAFLEDKKKKKVENPVPSMKFNWIIARSQPLQPLNKKLYKLYIR